MRGRATTGLEPDLQSEHDRALGRHRSRRTVPRPVWLIGAVLILLPAFGTTLSAQTRPDSARTSVGPGRARQRAGGRENRGAARPGAQRRALERRVRQAFAGVVRRQLQLDDEGMRRLQETDAKYERQRRALSAGERTARLALRAAMQDSTKRDQDVIARRLDDLVGVQRRRAELLEAEQKDLSSFLTPMQRAQYLSLRERMTRRLMNGAAATRGRRSAPPDSGGAPR